MSMYPDWIGQEEATINLPSTPADILLAKKPPAPTNAASPTTDFVTIPTGVQYG